jgi:hypothetical protein
MVGGWSVFGRPHNAVFRSLATAQGARPSQLTWTNYAELKHLYTAIFRVNTGWDNSHRCKLVRLDDYRLTAGTPVAAVAPTAHASLSGLELAGTAITYGHINDQAQTIAGVKTFSSGINFTAQTEKTIPVDADVLPLNDSADTNILKKLTWANLKATLISTVMTWTGKQTFDGGAAIKGATAAVAAGYVGEVLAMTTRSVTMTNAGGWLSNTSGAVNLTAGTYIIVARFEFDATSTTDTGLYIALATNSNADNTGIIVTYLCDAYGSYPSGAYVSSFQTTGSVTLFVKAVGPTNGTATGNISGTVIRLA